MDLDGLDRALIRAHAGDDFCALIALYTLAADECEQAGDIDATCFYLTHAYVYALQDGAAEAGTLQRCLQIGDRTRGAQPVVQIYGMRRLTDGQAAIAKIGP